jgi:hypothetical protein
MLKFSNLNDKQKFAVAVVARVVVPMIAVVAADVLVKRIAKKDA